MGIPLWNVPEVREFYDEDKSSIGEIDLDYFKPNSAYPRHCIAARITAENPDEGFKPTSGKIERIVFQSNQKVWVYFSVVAVCVVNEYADSQFGHIFANAPTREEAPARWWAPSRSSSSSERSARRSSIWASSSRPMPSRRTPSTRRGSTASSLRRA